MTLTRTAGLFFTDIYPQQPRPCSFSGGRFPKEQAEMCTVSKSLDL